MSANLFSFEVQFQGKPAQVVLANLPWKDVVGIAIDPQKTAPERLPLYFASNVLWSIEMIAGMSATRKRRAALDAEPAAVAAVLAKRCEILMQLRGAGRMYAQCPHCNLGEVEMSLLGLFDTLGVMPPAMISDDFGFFLPPVAHVWDGPPVRPKHFTYSSRIRFALPTALVGLPRAGFEGGVLGRATGARTAPAYARWENDGINAPLDQTWRSRDRATFQATIALIAAIRELVPPGEPTIEAFEELPAIDVYFLDAIYHLAFNTSVPEHALPRTCPACAKAFIPVAEMSWDNTPP